MIKRHALDLINIREFLLGGRQPRRKTPGVCACEQVHALYGIKVFILHQAVEREREGRGAERERDLIGGT